MGQHPAAPAHAPATPAQGHPEAMQTEQSNLLAVSTVTVSQIMGFPVDTNRFQLHGLVVQADNCDSLGRPSPRKQRFGGKSSLAVVLQDKDSHRITFEILTSDEKFMEHMANMCVVGEAVLVYRPTVATCQ